MSDEKILCIMCDWLIAIDIENTLYCGLWGKVKPRKICKTFKNIEMFKEFLKRGEHEKKE